MPFTFSHPAAILPLNHFFKRKLSTTGLVAGSLVPDFEYFLRAYHDSFYSHTWKGLFWFDVPLGLVLCFLYHNIVRKPFFAHAPLPVKSRLVPFQTLQWNKWFTQNWRTVLFSILLGAFTHLLWDKLTHHTVPLVQSASGIRHYVARETYKEIAYPFFWDVNSLIGAFFTIYAIWTLPSDKQVAAGKNIHRYWLCFSGVAFIILWVQLKLINDKILDNLVIAGINAVLLSLIFTSLFFSPRLRLERKDLLLAGKK